MSSTAQQPQQQAGSLDHANPPKLGQDDVNAIENQKSPQQQEQVPQQRPEQATGPRVEHNDPTQGEHTEKQTASGGVSEVAQQRPDIAGDSERDHAHGAPDDGYPPQLHAGKVGLGPNYAKMHGHVTMGEKITGLETELKGKVTRKPDMVQEGRDKVSGEEKRRKQEEEEQGNFGEGGPKGKKSP